jgi:hypothetical protein
MSSKNDSKRVQGALKLRDACHYLGGISPVSMRRLIARGLIKSNRSLRHVLIPVAELERFINLGSTRCDKLPTQVQ